MDIMKITIKTLNKDHKDINNLNYINKVLIMIKKITETMMNKDLHLLIIKFTHRCLTIFHTMRQIFQIFYLPINLKPILLR